jgi:hypothetical protein
MTRLMRAALLVVFVSSLVHAADDPMIGTWKLNIAKSTFPAGTAPKSGTLKFSPSPDGYKAVADSVEAKGEKVHTEITFKTDGKDYPVDGASGTTFSMKKVDDRTMQIVWKRDGKTISTSTAKFSADWKTVTEVQKDLKNQSDTLVYNKQ